VAFQCSTSHSRVAPENVGLQKYNTFACHTCNEVRLFWEFAKRKLATQKDKTKIINTKTDGFATCLSVALSVSREERCEVFSCFHVVVKMYRHSMEERVFIMKTIGLLVPFKNCQRRFVEQFGGRNPPLKR
jgi:hypothetical protein